MKYFIPLALIISVAHAQSLDLKTALSEVIKDSPRIEAEEARSEEVQWKSRESWGGFLPRLRMGGTYLTDKKYQFINVNLGGNPSVFPTIIPNSQFNFLAELPLFDGFASTNRFRAAQQYAEAAHDTLNWEKFKTRMQVTLAFYQALSSKILKDVAEQNLKALEDHQSDVKLFRKNGLSTNYDVLRVGVESSRARTDLADAEDEIIIAQERLAEMLGHETEARQLVGDLPVPDEALLSFVTAARAERDDLKALRLQAEARKLEETAAGRFWVPEFSFFGQYTWYNNLSRGLDDWDAYRNARQVGFMMTWNIFDGLVSYSRSQEAIQRKVQSEKMLRTGELEAGKDVRLWARRYRSQCRIYQARIEDISKSQESVRLAREGKKAGARTDSDLLDAEADLYRSKAGAVKAQMAALEAMIKLQLALGSINEEGKTL